MFPIYINKIILLIYDASYVDVNLAQNIYLLYMVHLWKTGLLYLLSQFTSFTHQSLGLRLSVSVALISHSV